MARPLQPEQQDAQKGGRIKHRLDCRNEGQSDKQKDQGDVATTQRTAKDQPQRRHQQRRRDHVGAQREGVQEHIATGRIYQTAKQRRFAVGETAHHSRDHRDRDDFERKNQKADKLDMVDIVAGQRGHPEKQRDKGRLQPWRRTPEQMLVNLAEMEKFVPVHAFGKHELDLEQQHEGQHRA